MMGEVTSFENFIKGISWLDRRPPEMKGNEIKLLFVYKHTWLPRRINFTFLHQTPSISACTNYDSELSLYISTLKMIFFTFGSKRFTFGFTKPIIKLTKSNLMRIKTNQHIY